MGHKGGHQHSGARGRQADLPVVRTDDELLDDMEEAELNQAQKLCREHTKDAVDALAEVCNDGANTGTSRVAAARELLNQGWDRPTGRQGNLAGADGIHLQIINFTPGAEPVQTIVQVASPSPPLELEDDDDFIDEEFDLVEQAGESLREGL
jgi:hypothetical protein